MNYRDPENRAEVCEGVCICDWRGNRHVEGSGSDSNKDITQSPHYKLDPAELHAHTRMTHPCAHTDTHVQHNINEPRLDDDPLLHLCSRVVEVVFIPVILFKFSNLLKDYRCDENAGITTNQNPVRCCRVIL